MRSMWFIVLCLLLFVGCGTCCFVRYWQFHSMTELLSIPAVVVYGREILNISVAPDRVDSIFAVSCVLRSDNSTIGANITVEGVWPRKRCSVTHAVYSTGNDVIVGLKRLSDNTFEWDERNPLQSIAFEGFSQNLMELATTCGLQNWTSPDGVSDTTCPFCGHPANVSNPFQTVCLIDQLTNETCTDVPRPSITGVCTCDKTRRPSKDIEVTGGIGIVVIPSLVMVLMTVLLSSSMTW
ncbi:uncharacterized protein LOC110459989 [Mizuhopecten yessoensis]|uniref:Uncharacterized protein n=1 Tax=Mizuhopecten yessoensis TaxID=6573 RepID=A0A210Q3B1_MIZYE|nr:uncharacterized protein LOC110459989 [Mizuhopecten yessoensis]OWF43248.1 hypothetical protein KP79_PYT18801 [Mizuhopecten yessoensis]